MAAFVHQFSCGRAYDDDAAMQSGHADFLGSSSAFFQDPNFPAKVPVSGACAGDPSFAVGAFSPWDVAFVGQAPSGPYHSSSQAGPVATTVPLPHFGARKQKGSSSRSSSGSESTCQSTGAVNSSGSSGGDFSMDMCPPGLELVAPHQKIQNSPKATQQQQAQEMQQKSLVIAYFPRGATTDELSGLFTRFGGVTSVRIVRDGNGVSKCFGFVNFETAEAANKAMAECGRGRVILTDALGKKWHVKADRSQLSGPRQSRRRLAGSRNVSA